MTQVLKEQLKKHLHFPQLFQVILSETINQPILDEFTFEETDRTIGPFYNEMVTILSVKEIDCEYYGLVSSRDRIVGWTLLKNSLYIFPKRSETIKINQTALSIPEVNNKLNINTDLLFRNKQHILLTKSYTLINDDRYELILAKGKLAALLNEDMLHRSYPINIELELDTDVVLYKDSNLKVRGEKKFEDSYVQTQLIFPDLHLLKVEKEQIFYWIDTNDISIDFKQYIENNDQYETTEEILSLERMKTKKVIQAVLKANKDLYKENESLQRRIEFLERKEVQFENLRNSKLGRIQVAIWNRIRRK